MDRNEKLMQELYYSPAIQATSLKKLYDKVRDKGITQKQVKEFLDKQESHQLFKKTNRKINFFPIYAEYKNEIFQSDIIDMSNIATANDNYKYLLTCIDVYSRVVYIIPMKNKSTVTILEAFEQIFKIAKPEQLTIDQGSEFISIQFKNLMKQNNIDINYVEVGDHHKLGIIDRFVRTLRDRINKYLEMHNTTKYIDVLPEIIKGYNNSYHSGIKKTPNEVKGNDENIDEILFKKYMKAKQDEPIFEIGQRVRCIINRKAFEKKSLPKWSKTIHNIVLKTSHSYQLDNDQVYKYYELQPVNEVQRIEKESTAATREEMKKDITSTRRFNKEGIEKENILKGKRERKQTDRLHY